MFSEAKLLVFDQSVHTELHFHLIFYTSTSCCALCPSSLHPSIHSSVHPSTPPAHHRHHYCGCTLGLIYSPIFPPASSSKRAARGGEGGEGGRRQRCREQTQDERGDGDVVRRGEMRSDSSVRRNDCSALGSDERGSVQTHSQAECEHVHACKWSCTHWFIAQRVRVKSCTHTEAEQASSESFLLQPENRGNQQQTKRWLKQEQTGGEIMKTRTFTFYLGLMWSCSSS